MFSSFILIVIPSSSLYHSALPTSLLYSNTLTNLSETLKTKTTISLYNVYKDALFEMFSSYILIVATSSFNRYSDLQTLVKD